MYVSSTFNNLYSLLYESICVHLFLWKSMAFLFCSIFTPSFTSTETRTSSSLPKDPPREPRRKRGLICKFISVYPSYHSKSPLFHI